MAEAAAFLVDEVLPQARYRQWTLTVPKHIRYLLAVDSKLFSKVVTTFLRTIFSWQRRQAKKIGISEPLCASVSLLQRFGSLLQLNPHPHSWLPDGVFHVDSTGKMAFQWLPPPEQHDIEQLLSRIRRRILKLCDVEPKEPDDDQVALAQAQAEAIETAVRAEPGEGEHRQRPQLSSYQMGFSLHAGLSVAADRRKKLEQLIRYGMRPAFAQKRLSLLCRWAGSSAIAQTLLHRADAGALRAAGVLAPPHRDRAATKAQHHPISRSFRAPLEIQPSHQEFGAKAAKGRRIGRVSPRGYWGRKASNTLCRGRC
jgi:hypothetical protein